MLVPDPDMPLAYASGRQLGVCWLRGFPAERLAVVTELQEANPGPSITNAIEGVASAIETLLGISFGVDGWSLVEHYQGGLVHAPSLDFVRFAGRDAEGAVELPSWSRLAPTELPWLWMALERRLDVRRVSALPGSIALRIIR